MEDRIRDLDKILKVIESRNELLNEEIKRNEEDMKKIQNEIDFILDATESSIETDKFNVKTV